MSADVGSSSQAAARRQVVETARRLSARGLSPGGSGNLSLRTDDVVLITPTGGAFSRLDEQSLSVLDPHGEHVAGPAPSKEWPLHLAVHEMRPSARAVVHLHSPYATALACLAPEGEDGSMPLLTPYQAMKLGHPLAVAPYAPPGTTALADSVQEPVRDAAAVLMANHGSLTAGADLDAAADLAEELEAAAQLFFTLGLHHGRHVRTLG